MKPIDLSAFDLHHVLPCDPERRAAPGNYGTTSYKRIQVPVNRPSMCAAAPDDDDPQDGLAFDLNIVRLETMRHRNRADMRGLDALVDIERARRAIDQDAKIGVVIVVRDPATFDAISFPGQVEAFTPEGRSKKLDLGNWLVEVLYLEDTDHAAYDCGDGDGDDAHHYRPARTGIFSDAAG
jgi:hypothetical protein